MDPEVPFCGNSMAAMANTAAWVKRKLAWCVRGAVLPQLGEGAMRAAFLEAFTNWESVCGLTFHETTEPQEADIVVTTGNIDGGYSVLAWSQLPSGDDRKLMQKYDTSERFVVALRPPQGTIDLVAVATHEIGHAIGLDHAAQGSSDLLAPTYRAGLRTPQRGDVERVIAMYGGPVQQLPPSGVRKSSWMLILDQHEQQLAKFRLEQTA